MGHPDLGRFALRRVLSCGHLITPGIAALFLSAIEAAAAEEAAVPSLVFPPGARAEAMGRGAVTVAEDATAMFWNPALLAGMEGATVLFMPRYRINPGIDNDLHHLFAGATWKLPSRNGVLGLRRAPFLGSFMPVNSTWALRTAWSFRDL